MSARAYDEFLTRKIRTTPGVGIDVDDARLHPRLFPFQREIVLRMLALGRGAIFASTGLGKTSMQIEWARIVAETTELPVLIFAPLAVASQTIREARIIGVDVTSCKEQSDVTAGVNITNYDRLDRFDCSILGGIVIEESSILKATDGKTRTHLIEVAQSIRFRLACTATPAPNDVMELGNHADFLGVMKSAEMLATYFVHDGGETQKWRLKGHAEKSFWAWVSSWAMVVDSPSDLGYDGSAYVLPELRMHEHVLDAPAVTDGETLFALPASSLTERRGAKKSSIQMRVDRLVSIVLSGSDGDRVLEPWIIWCHLNSEQDLLAKAFGESAFSIFGSMPSEEKERQLLCWLDGERPILISKPSMLGFGINAQICSSMAFVGIDDSWESLYQSIRRCWRFGQTRPVDVHLILSSAEIRVLENLQRKERDAAKMRRAMAAATESARVPMHAARPHYTHVTVEVPSWLHRS